MRLYDQRNIPNHRCYADTMGPITMRSGAQKHIFLTTCAFTKFVTGAVLNDLTSQSIARAFLNSHVLIHGVPEQIVTDNGSSIDQSQFIQTFYSLIGVQKNRTTIYHPQANLVERANKSIKAILSKIVHEAPNDWPKQLQLSLFCYNATIHKATGFEPSYLFLGRKVRAPNDIFFGTTSSEFFRGSGHYAHTMYWKMRQVYGIVSNTLNRQQRMLKKIYDKATYITLYKVGDFVALYMPLPPTQRANNKFKSNLQVLYQVKKVISDHNYLVERLQTKKRKVVHHDLMRYIPEELASKLEGYNASAEEVLLYQEDAPETEKLKPKTRSNLEEDDIILQDVDVKELVKNQRNSKDLTSNSDHKPHTQEVPNILIPEELEWDPYQIPQQQEEEEEPGPSTAQPQEQPDLRNRPSRNRRAPDRYGNAVYY